MTKKISLIIGFIAMTLLMATNSSVAMSLDNAKHISIESSWARATSSLAKTGAAYLTIHNSGDTPDRLIAVESPLAQKAGVHQSLLNNGIMKMQAVQALDIPAHHDVIFKPGSYHIMFMGLKKPFKTGEMLPLTLTFEKSGKIKVMVKILKMGATGGMKMNMKMN